MKIFTKFSETVLYIGWLFVIQERNKLRKVEYAAETVNNVIMIISIRINSHTKTNILHQNENFSKLIEFSLTLKFYFFY